MEPSRRLFLGSAGAIGLAAPGAGMGETAGPDAGDLQAFLERYVAFGSKASGGAGDNACGAWLETELTAYGFRCHRQYFDVPFFKARRTRLTSGALEAEVIAQAIVSTTGPQGISAPLRLASAGTDLSGALALVDLPYKRWSSLADPEIRRRLDDAFRRDAAGAVLITNGPTRQAIALNVSTRHPGYERPLAVLAPKDADGFLEAAKKDREGRLIIDGDVGRRPAFNLVGRLDRGASRDLILSTPRSGWFICAAERGSGLAIWLWLTQWLARSSQDLNLEVLATSGHEYEYLGGERYLAKAPPPGKTKLWTHIGASAAARDWHELGKLLPLPSADSQRVLTATADIVVPVREAFKGISGLEATYVADRGTAGGELVNVLAAGYATMMGLYGGHRFFHTQEDDLRCTSGELVAPVARAFQTALSRCLT